MLINLFLVSLDAVAKILNVEKIETCEMDFSYNSVKKSGCFQENWFHKINGCTNPGDLAGRRRVPRRQRLGSCCARASSYQSMKRTFSVIIHKSCQDHAMRIFTISKKHRRVKEGEPDDHAHVSKQVFIDNFVYSSIGPATR